MSVADSVRAAAEAAVKESERKALEAAGMVYDSNSGMYYDYNSGYYYDAVCISFRKLSVKPRHWLTLTSSLSYVDTLSTVDAFQCAVVFQHLTSFTCIP